MTPISEDTTEYPMNLVHPDTTIPHCGWSTSSNRSHHPSFVVKLMCMKIWVVKIEEKKIWLLGFPDYTDLHDNVAICSKSEGMEGLERAWVWTLKWVENRNCLSMKDVHCGKRTPEPLSRSHLNSFDCSSSLHHGSHDVLESFCVFHIKLHPCMKSLIVQDMHVNVRQFSFFFFMVILFYMKGVESEDFVL